MALGCPPPATHEPRRIPERPPVRVAPAFRPRRDDVITVGLNDFGELTGDRFATGIRVPPLVGPTYRVLAAVAELGEGDEVVGLRQFASLASYVADDDTPPIYPEIRPIQTSGWRFPDTAPIRWTVTSEPLACFFNLQGPHDQDSFIFRDCSGPALVYETATIPAIPPLPGYLGLTAYAPPPIRGQVIDLYRDIRFPEQQNQFLAVRLPIDRPTRVRVYVDVQQTDIATRFIPDLTSDTAGQLAFAQGLVVEDQFLQLFPDAIVHAVGAALIVDRH
jgi:hypothetical protein